MLIEFRFRNFLSFRDECVFSMVASKACKAGPLLDDNVVSVERFGGRPIAAVRSRLWGERVRKKQPHRSIQGCSKHGAQFCRDRNSYR